MATYEQYLAALNGKTFTAQYIYVATATTETSSSANGITSYSGTAASFANAPSQAGTFSTVNATTGVFTIAGASGGPNFQIHGSSADGNYLFFTSVDATRLYVLSNNGTMPTGTISYSTANPYNTPTPVCFAAGTRIATRRGDIAIEELAVGDMVLVEGGRQLPVRWVGHRRLVCKDSPWARHFAPIRIEAGALGPACPTRDLVVSPGHCLALGEHWLVEAEHLVNGTTIRTEPVDAIDYYHVELSRHAVIYAEGAPVESFVDVGNKGDFEGDAELVPDARTIAAGLSGYCRPVAMDRATIAALRKPIDDRAKTIAWARHLIDA